MFVALLAGCVAAGVNSSTMSKPIGPTNFSLTTSPVPSSSVPATSSVPTSTAAGPIVTIVKELTDEARYEISATWYSVNAEVLDWEAKNNIDDARVKYYGSFNDKHVLTIMEDCPLLPVDYSMNIGPYKLSSYAEFEIYVYHAGTITTLKAAYDANLLAAEEVEAVFASLKPYFLDD